MPRILLAVLMSVLGLTAHAACDRLPKNWERSSAPILRDRFPGGGYEAASDAHVFKTSDGKLRMIYSGDDGDFISIKMATAKNWRTWKPARVLLGPSVGHVLPKSKETPFYYRAPTGEHQIYFIGYNDENTYQSAIYLATSSKLQGPYTVRHNPIVPLGRIDRRDVQVITSPSIVKHGSELHMVFLGWDNFRNVSQVWAFGAISRDWGRTWTNFREVDVPIGMEGQITPIPGGGYVAVATGDARNGREAIYLACAQHPFGPYKTRQKPILTQAGAPWEVDEIIAPQIFFGDRKTRLVYTGADHKKGWWIMQAVGRGK